MHLQRYLQGFLKDRALTNRIQFKTEEASHFSKGERSESGGQGVVGDYWQGASLKRVFGQFFQSAKRRSTS